MFFFNSNTLIVRSVRFPRFRRARENLWIQMRNRAVKKQVRLEPPRNVINKTAGERDANKTLNIVCHAHVDCKNIPDKKGWGGGTFFHFFSLSDCSWNPCSSGDKPGDIKKPEMTRRAARKFYSTLVAARSFGLVLSSVVSPVNPAVF